MFYLKLNSGKLKDKLFENQVSNINNLTNISLIADSLSKEDDSEIHIQKPSFQNNGVNYFIKSSLIMEINIVTIFNFIMDTKSQINWKTHLHTINIDTDKQVNKQTDNASYNFTYKYNDDEFKIENITTEYFKKDRSVVIVESTKDGELINTYVLDADSSWNKTRVKCYSLVNNTLPIYYFKSVFKQLKNLNDCLSYYMINSICFSNESKENVLLFGNSNRKESLCDNVQLGGEDKERPSIKSIPESSNLKEGVDVKFIESIKCYLDSLLEKGIILITL